MRTKIAFSVCCALVVAVGVVRYSNSKSQTPSAPLAQQVAAMQPSAAEPTTDVVTQATTVQDASAPAGTDDTTFALLAQAPVEKEPAAKTKAKAEPKKRAAPAAKKDASDSKKAPFAKSDANGDDLKSIKKELAQARRDRTALDKKIAALEKQVEELEASATTDAKPSNAVKGEKSNKDEAPKAEKAKSAATKASAIKRAKPPKAGAAA